MVSIFKKILPIFTGLLITGSDLVKIKSFEDFLFSLIWNSNALGIILIILECVSAMMLLLKKKIHLFAIILLLLLAFQLFNYSHRILYVGSFSGSWFLSIEYFIFLLIILTFSAVTAFLYSLTKSQYRFRLTNAFLIIITAAFFYGLSINFSMECFSKNHDRKMICGYYQRFLYCLRIPTEIKLVYSEFI